MSDRLHWVGQGEQHLALLAGEKQQKKWDEMQHGNAGGWGGITASLRCNYASIMSYFDASERKSNKKHFCPRHSIHFSCKQHAAYFNTTFSRHFFF